MIKKYKLNNSCITYVVYEEKKKATKVTKKNPLIGQQIYSKYYGWGTVISAVGDLCTIQYEEIKIQCYKKRALELIEKTKKITGGNYENYN